MPFLINAAVVILVALTFPLARYIPPMGELIRWLDNFSYRRQIASAPGPDDSRLFVVDLDGQTFEETGARPSPLDRDLLAELLERIATAKPAAIVVDIDIRHRLRPIFEAEQDRLPVTESWLDGLDRTDDRLTATLNRLLHQGIPIVLGFPQGAVDQALPMGYDSASDRLYFGRASAWIRSVDRVIYGLPTWIGPEQTMWGGVKPAPQPSLALAAWAADRGIPASALLTGSLPAGLDGDLVQDYHKLKSGKQTLVNWHRLNPRGESVLIPHLSVAAILRADAAPAGIDGKIAIVGRTHFVEEPIRELPDRYPTPYTGRKVNGVDLQAIFIDNLVNRCWLSKVNWWLALVVSGGLGILLGSLFIAIGQYIAQSGIQATWALWLTYPQLSFAVGLALSLLVALIVNLLFIQRGMYMVSLALIPLSGFIKAILYTAWTMRP
jgi:CHASE2 domain-containing sensor protein